MSNLNFVQVPVSALMSIKDTSIKIYSIIYTGCILRNNEFYHSYSQFVTELGVNIPYVKRALKDLKEGGYIEIESGRGAKKPNTFHLTNRVKYEPIDDNSEVELTDNRVKSEPINRVKSEPQKEYKKENIVKRVKENIKEKRESNETINGKLNRKDEVKEKQSNNNMNFNKNGIYMELNSHPAVQSKDWTNKPKEEKTHSSSAGTTKVIQIGDTRYAVKTANTDYSSIWDSFPGGTASREKNKVQRVTTTEDRKDNTLSNASLHNENEDNPNEAKPTTAGQNTNPKTALNNPKTAGATETVHRGFNGTQVDNYPTHTEKTPQERNNEGNRGTHNPMDCGGMSIDDLEDIYNGGNQTQPISKVRSQTTSKAKSNEGGGGRKFTPHKQWDIEYRLALQHIDNSSDIKSKLTSDDIEILFEGANDKYRAIDTLKAVDRMLLYRVKFPRYLEMLQTAIETIETNEDVYSPKQYDYAWNIYDKCFDRYEKITN